MSMCLIKCYCFETEGGFCLTVGKMGKYQAILLAKLNVKFTSALNAATLLPDPNDHLEYDCLDIVHLPYRPGFKAPGLETLYG